MKKLLALLLAVVMVVSVLPLAALAEEAACEHPNAMWCEADSIFMEFPCNGGWTVPRVECPDCGGVFTQDGTAPLVKSEATWQDGVGHQPGYEEYPANATSCGDGWTVPYYSCVRCYTPVDAEGNALDYELYYKIGDGKHTLGEFFEANYNTCQGGHTEDYYACAVCYAMLDENAQPFDAMYESGKGIHVLGETLAPDYTACGGGREEELYRCKYCWSVYNKEGVSVNEMDYIKDGDGKHTPGKISKMFPVYTECGGGFKVAIYDCSVCGMSCDETGAEQDWEALYIAGNGKHTPGQIAGGYPEFTECGGGFKEDIYECSVCGWACDKNGAEPDYGNLYEDGNGKHTPGALQKADYTECGGGIKVDYYMCHLCKSYCDKDGNQLSHEDIYENPKSNKHTPGDLIKANYTECGGGFTEDHYECKVCGRNCDKDGKQQDLSHKEPVKDHTPGKKVPADYTVCAGGFREDYYMCTVCGYACDSEGGEDLDYRMGNDRHTAGTLHKADYTVCGGGMTIDYYECKDCGVPVDKNGIYIFEYMADGNGKHTPGEIPGEAPTCTEDGHTGYHGCTVCYFPLSADNKPLTEEELEALADKILLEATHKEEVIPAVAPTADKTGLTTGKKCSVCGEVLEAPKEVAVLGKLEEALTTEAKVETGAPATALTTETWELLNATLTPAEIERVSQGEKSQVYLTVSDVSATVAQEQKLEIQKKVGEGDKVVYLDIDLFKKVGNDEASQITQTGDEISITVSIPKDMTGDSFYVIRYHEGQVDRIDGDYNKEANTFTFKTDHFSTYALCSENKGEQSGTSEAIPEPSKPAATNPQTGDETPLALFGILFAAAVCGMAVILIQKRKVR